MFFAIPWQSQQSTEVWALAKIRFFFKPRKRVWDQSGVKELVTITAPKHVEVDYTNGLSQGEVTNRLKALAETIDTRGWAVKNVSANMYSPSSWAAAQDSTERLLNVNDFSREVPNYDVSAEQDVLDPKNNPIAQQFDSLISASSQAHRQQVVDNMHQASGASQTGLGSDNPAAWFSGPARPTTQTALDTPAPSDADDAALSQQLHSHSAQQDMSSAHLRTIQPGGTSQPAHHSAVSKAARAATAKPVTPKVDPAILELANNNDLSVATIAREANRHSSQERPDEPDEVVISLR
jgi:hypothetical protein